jgi:hypothetical protein
METRAEYATAGAPSPAPPLSVRVNTFTPIFDAVVQDVGLVGASVYGRIWRYCQGGRHCCNAALGTIADALNISVRTVIRWAKELCEKEYLADCTPDLRNKPHTYVTTNKLQLTVSIEATVTESPIGVTESHTRYDRESLEETIEETIEKTEEQESADADLTPHSFEDWLAAGQATGNKQAVLKRMHDTLFPDRDSPSYSYIGTAVKRVGGPGRLAQLLWQAAAQRPTGDVLAYIQATEKGRKNRNGNGRHDAPGPVSHIVTEEECVRLTPEQEAELMAAVERGTGDEWVAANVSRL